MVLAIIVEISGFAHEAGEKGGGLASGFELGADDLGFGVPKVRGAGSLDKFYDKAGPVVMYDELTVCAVVGDKEFW